MRFDKINGTKGALLVFLAGLSAAAICFGLSEGGAFWFSRQEPKGTFLMPYHAMGVFVQVPQWLYFLCTAFYFLSFLGLAVGAAGLLLFFLLRISRGPETPSALMQLNTLTSREKKIIESVFRPAWKKITLYCIIVIIMCGTLALALAVEQCIHASRMVRDNSIQPEFTPTLVESCVSLMLGGIALMSAIFMWITRSYGLVIRKLGENYGAQPSGQSSGSLSP